MLRKEISSTVLMNGRIYLFDDPFTQVENLAIANDRIISAGPSDEVITSAGSTSTIIDLEERTIVPGLIDAHVHLKSMARKLTLIDCETNTLEECLERIKSQVDEVHVGDWIMGHGWNQNPWGRFGTAKDLDGITSQHPIYLIAKSGHAAWVNSLALSLAGIDDTTSSVEGGEIQRDPNGLPSGILFENAMKLISVHVPEMDHNDLMQAILSVQDQLWRIGLTGLHDFDGPNAFSALQGLDNDNLLGIRVVKNIPLEHLDNAIELGLHSGFGNPWLRVGNIKIFSDGALGPQTAAMFAPYEDQDEYRGILLTDEEELSEIIFNCARNSLAVSVHAIGDQANHIVLDAFESVRKVENSHVLPRLRHRIEHLQCLHPEDINRPAFLGIIASMQPIHATSDMVMADLHWGDRSRYSYAWRSQLDTGAILAFGSDAPVESPNPFLGLHAAVTRRRLDGSPNEEGWIPEEKITLREAFLAYTHGPAYAAGQENQLGCLLPGYLADLIVLPEDPFECPPDELPYFSPIATMVGGDWKFREF